MKKKLVFAAVFLFIGLVALGTKLVLAETQILPRVTTACETKTGLIHGFNDGFSILEKCSKGSRQVILGEKASSSSGQAVNLGKIKFISDDPGSMYIYILNDEGKFFGLSRSADSSGNWDYDSRLDLPSGVSVDDVVIWNRYMFMTKDGELYYVDPMSDAFTAWLGPFPAPIQ